MPNRLIIFLLLIIALLSTTLLYNHWGSWSDQSLNDQFKQIQKLAEDEEWEQVEFASLSLIKALDIKIKQDESNFEYWMMLGETLIINGDLDPAMSSYRKAQALRPNDEFVNKRLGQLTQFNQRSNSQTPVEQQAEVQEASESSAQPTISANIVLSDTLDTGHISQQAAVFAYIRVAGGAPMPIAIKRLSFSELPTSVQLTAANQMMQSGQWREDIDFEWVNSCI